MIGRLSVSEEKLRELINAYKLKYHLTDRELSQEIGCSRQKLSEFRRGKTVGRNVNMKIITWLDRRVQYERSLLLNMIISAYGKNIDVNTLGYNSMVNHSKQLSLEFMSFLENLQNISGPSAERVMSERSAAVNKLLVSISCINAKMKP